MEKLTWLSSFFLILTGVSSSSSILDATLESALIILVVFKPLVFGGVPRSKLEFGVAIEFVELTIPLLLLLVALGVLLLWPRELDVESGISSDGNSHPWHDFFEFESVGPIIIIN